MEKLLCFILIYSKHLLLAENCKYNIFYDSLCTAISYKTKADSIDQACPRNQKIV
jgi:hypothetical protein